MIRINPSLSFRVKSHAQGQKYFKQPIARKPTRKTAPNCRSSFLFGVQFSLTNDIFALKERVNKWCCSSAAEGSENNNAGKKNDSKNYRRDPKDLVLSNKKIKLRNQTLSLRHFNSPSSNPGQTGHGTARFLPLQVDPLSCRQRTPLQVHPYSLT